jgi:hypothetical protein
MEGGRMGPKTLTKITQFKETVPYRISTWWVNENPLMIENSLCDIDIHDMMSYTKGSTAFIKIAGYTAIKFNLHDLILNRYKNSRNATDNLVYKELISYKPKPDSSKLTSDVFDYYGLCHPIFTQNDWHAPFMEVLCLVLSDFIKMSCWWNQNQTKIRKMAHKVSLMRSVMNK